MKVIATGSPDKVWPRRMVLPCCQSLVEIVPEDIQTSRDYTGESNGPHVTCLACGATPALPERVRIEGDAWRKAQGDG